MSTFVQHCVPIDVEWLAADMAAFEFSAAHASPDPLDYQTAFKFGHRRDDGDDDGAARWAARIQLLTEADELDVDMAEFVQHFEKMPCGTCPAVPRHTTTTSNCPRRASTNISSRAGRRTRAPLK